MNSKSLQYHNHIDSNREIPTLPQTGIFRALLNKLATWVTSSPIERHQAAYRARRARAEHADTGRDILRSLPTTEKLQLGMYRFMD